jgi:uncharacterized membrane protein YbjE (DUF340 family)
MFIVIALMLSGMLIGYLLRNQKMSWIHKIITFFIWLLLFLLGNEVGKDKRIIDGLYTLGLEAMVITIFTVLGSVIAAWLLWKNVTKKQKNDL